MNAAPSAPPASTTTGPPTVAQNSHGCGLSALTATARRRSPLGGSFDRPCSASQASHPTKSAPAADSAASTWSPSSRRTSTQTTTIGASLISGAAARRAPAAKPWRSVARTTSASSGPGASPAPRPSDSPRARLRVVVAGFAGQHHARGLAAHDHLGRHGPDLASARVLDQRVGAVERRELLEVLDRREDEAERAVGVGLQRGGGLEPTPVDDLLAVDDRLGLVGD